MKAGRQKKSTVYPWDARLCAQALREALEIARQKPEPKFDHPDTNTPNPLLSPKGDAACTLGILILDSCDPTNAARFLRKMADHFERPLPRSPDEAIFKAFLLAEPKTFPEWKRHYEKLTGKKLAVKKDDPRADKIRGLISSLRRSIERVIGHRLYEETKKPKYL